MPGAQFLTEIALLGLSSERSEESSFSQLQPMSLRYTGFFASLLMNSALFVILNGVKNPVRAHRSILLTNNWILRSAQNDNLGKFIYTYHATPPGCSLVSE